MEIWKPLREKITFFYTQPLVGTDDRLYLISLRKADLNLIATIFNSQLDDILCAPENIAELNTTLQQILSTLDEISDSSTYKLTFSLLTKMIYCWGGSPSTQRDVEVLTDTSKKGLVGNPKGPKTKDHLRIRPLEGFNVFIFQHIIPAAMSLPMRTEFNLSDGQSIIVLTEISILHKTAIATLGKSYCDFLNDKYFPSIQCPSNLAYDFIKAVQDLDKKQHKKFLQVIWLFNQTFYAKPQNKVL